MLLTIAKNPMNYRKMLFPKIIDITRIQVDISILWIVLFVILLPGFSHSQHSSKLKEYEVRVLEANLSKKADELNIQIAENNLNKGLAGLTPSVGLTAGDNISMTSNITESATTVNKNGFRVNNSVNAGIFANMALYNGGRNKNLYERYKILIDQANLNQRELAEQLIFQIRSLYYQAIRQNQLIKATEKAISYADQRLQLATNKLDIGKGNKVDVLQAEVDRNQYASEIEMYKNDLDNIYVQMNALMNLPLDNRPEITDSIFSIQSIDKEEIRRSMLSQHTEIIRNKINYNLSINKLQDVKGMWKPSLNASLGYSFSRSDNGGGFFRVNSSNGIAGGVTLNVPIYDGKAIKTQIKNAELTTKQVEIQQEGLVLNLTTELDRYYNNYKNAMKLLEIQQANVLNADENIKIGFSRFQAGLTDGFEFKQIQQSYTDANFRYIDALYQAKLNELQLNYLSGQILEN